MKYKVDDILIIKDNTSAHPFSIGDEVKVRQVVHESYHITSTDAYVFGSGWIDEEEVE